MEKRNIVIANLNLTPDGECGGRHWQEVLTADSCTIARAWGTAQYQLINCPIQNIMVTVTDMNNNDVFFHVDKIIAKFAPGITFETDLAGKEVVTA
jgi:hypothetical protein